VLEIMSLVLSANIMSSDKELILRGKIIIDPWAIPRLKVPHSENKIRIT